MAASQLFDCFLIEEPTPRFSRCVSILYIVAQLASLTPSLRKTASGARGTASQVAKTPEIQRLIGTHPPFLTLALTTHHKPLDITNQPSESTTITVFVDRSRSLGGGRTRVEVLLGASVGDLKQSIHRQCSIEPTTHTLLLHNLQPLKQDDQRLDTIGITDRSSVFLTLQGTHASVSAHRACRILTLQYALLQLGRWPIKSPTRTNDWFGLAT